MARYFIAVGGSGQHVALALADQIALAHHLRPTTLEPFEFLVLDRDFTSTSGTKTAWQLTQDQLELLRQADVGAAGGWQKSTPQSVIAPSREFNESTVRELVSGSWGPVFFDEPQLGVQFRAGYFGQAPVAATLFGDVLEDEKERRATAIKRLLDDPARRVVVAGSLVGGTGAGCLPRLVEFLGERPGSKVAAVVLLQWYRLGAKNGAFVDESAVRNDEMLSREPSALVYAAERLARVSATVLLGHPRLDSSNSERPWSGNTQQPAFEDLTLPHYAAATASTFLYAQQPAANSLYSVACPSVEKGLALTPGLGLFASDQTPGAYLELGPLVRRNLEYCERLYWVSRYLQAPPDLRITLRRGQLMVPRLDELRARCSASEAATLLSSLQALLAAKWAALGRLALSDSSLFGGSRLPESPESFFTRLDGGLDTLRGWTSKGALGEGKTVTALGPVLVAGLTAADPVQLQDSPVRCLPPSTGRANEVGSTSVRPGSLAQMSQSSIEQIIRYDHIVAHSLPTTRTVEFLLEQDFAGRLNPSAASDAGEPVGEGRNRAAWKRRWLFLWKGLCSGELSILAPRPDEGKVKLAAPLPQGVVVSKDGIVLGYTSPDVVLVPVVSADWDKRLADEPSDLSPATAKLLGWVRLVERLAGPRAALPKWFAWLLQWADKQALVTNADANVGFSGQKVFVKWPRMEKGVATDREFSLLLPGPGARDLLHFNELLDLFEVPVRTVGLAELPEQLRLLANRERCPVVTRFELTTGARERTLVVFRDRDDELKRLTEQLEFGVALLEDRESGRLLGVRVSDASIDRIAFISRRQVLTDAVQPIGDVNGTFEEYFPSYPVRAEWADLVDLSVEPAVVPNALGRTYRFRMKGLGQVEQAVRVLQRMDADLLLWPKFRSPLGDATPFRGYNALFDVRNEKDRLAVFGNTKGRREELDWSVRLAPDLSTQPLYVLDPDGIKDGGVPELFAIVRDGLESIGNGLFRTSLDPVESSGNEKWGIDFGTSSSVVAVQNGAEAVVLAPTGDLDQTRRYALKQPPSLEGCRWYPTWHDIAPRKGEAALSLPSQLVLLTSARPSEAELARAETLPYGQTFVLDHGGELGAGWQDPWRILSKLKWMEEDGSRRLSKQEESTRRAIRRAYLLHLLQLAYALRAGANGRGLPPGLPKEVETTFTLPLDMRESKLGETSPAKTFAEDTEAALKLISSATGATFSAKFIWESHAGAPRERTRHRVYAVADLGGGSLDMWGIDGREREYADSYRFGGHDLIDQWAFTAGSSAGESKRVELKRKLQNQPLATLRDERTDSQRAAIADGFFELATEAIVRWVAALALEQAKISSPSVSVELNLLGMGWGLNEGFDSQPSRYLRELERLVNQFLAQHARTPEPVTVALRSGALPAGTNRKAFLAYNAVIRGGEAISTLLGNSPTAFLGSDLFLEQGQGDGSMRLGWGERADFSIEGGAVSRLLLHDHDTRGQPEPLLRNHPLTDAELQLILQAMNEKFNRARGVYSGRAPIALALDKLRRHTEPVELAASARTERRHG